MLNRRTMLRGAIALGAATATAGCADTIVGDGVPDIPVVYEGRRGRAVRVRRGDRVSCQVGVHRRYSVARGKTVEVITMVPTGVPRESLGVCLALHGRFADARSMVGLGVPQFLGAAVRSGVPPFAVVAVDGDNTYWVPGDSPADDPQEMLLDELPGWLRELGLRAHDGAPRSALGISMGGYGGLVYARNRQESPLGAVATLSAGLLRTFGEARGKGIYSNRGQWRDLAPLRHADELPADTELGVWCGTEDRYYRVSRLLGEATGATVHFEPGRHSVTYWRTVLPEVLRFLGQHTR